LLHLAPVSAEDAEALHRISNEPLVRRYLWDDEEEPVLHRMISDRKTIAEAQSGTIAEDTLGGEEERRV
jgi:RimJ/RimL family protein N-acetyltransferase